MSTHKHIDKICCAALCIVLLLTLVLVNAQSLGVQPVSAEIGYESRLFDTSKVHTIEIEMEDWDSFIDTCENEEYSECSVVIDGETFKNTGIRAKGNTSLSSVARYGNDRYSFKIEFDCYDDTRTYHGLDKISLNNIIQDNTYMKDYLCYQMMRDSGVASPLCSYAYIMVNGEDWGLYLAVEAVEESFLTRNYGKNYGNLYKPDSMDMGGGRGNGGAFHEEEFKNKQENDSAVPAPGDGRDQPGGSTPPQGDMNASPEGKMPWDNSGDQSGGSTALPGDTSAPSEGRMPWDNSGDQPEGMPQIGTPPQNDDADFSGGGAPPQNGGNLPGGTPKGGAIPDSNDVSLLYTDDSYESYKNIFDNAKTDITDTDRDRLISSLKKLGDQEDLDGIVETYQVIRYFAVHNFVCNFDSYTGSMIHNYYLYEKDGKLSMIPWDYNLAFGAFEAGADAKGLINYPIDDPVSGGETSSRPMIAWIFENDEYTELYHSCLEELIQSYFDSGYFTEMVDSVSEMIAPYVDKDPSKFCTSEEFQKGISTLKSFCLLRAQSVSGQLNGTVPSTEEGQKAEDAALVDDQGIVISDMGSMR